MKWTSFLFRTPARRCVAVFAAFHMFFLGLFAQFPAQNALPGNCDTLLVIALSNTHLARAMEFLGMGVAGKSMFPVENILAYGESAPGAALLFIVFKLLGFGDVLAYYFYITFIFSLNALAVYVFSGLFLTSFRARIFAAFAFTCSNMMFAHIDDSIKFFYFLPLIAMTCLIRSFQEGKSGPAYAAAVVGGLQVYFSVYVFVYQTILLTFVALFHRFYRRQRIGAMTAAKAVGIYLLLAAPVLVFYSLAKLRLNIVSVYDAPHIIRVMSWQIFDMIWALPGNLLYGWITWLPQNWPQLRHHNLIGLLTFGGAIYALSRRGAHRPLLGGIALVGFLLALGPVIMFGYTEIVPTPMYIFYEWIPIFDYHRIPIRAYFMVLLAFSILAGYTVQLLLQRIPTRGMATAALVLLFGVQIIENVPFPIRAYHIGDNLEIPPEYLAFMQDKQGALILDLPSRFGFRFENWNPGEFYSPADFVHPNPSLPSLVVKDWDSVSRSSEDIFLYSRDVYYMNWQTRHRQNIVGGLNGYFPASRLIYQGWIEQLPSEESLRWLRDQGVEYIAYHREMLLPGDTDILNELQNSPLLRYVVNGERSIIFSFVENRE